MAALIFAEHLRREGLAGRVRVTSAGTGDWHIGQPADYRAAQVLAEHGYTTDHVAAQVNNDHLKAHLLVAIDTGNERSLRRLVAKSGGDRHRIRMLRSFDPEAAAAGDLDVPDPYFHEASFPEVLGMIESAMPGLLDWVRVHLNE
jgi:protein-tyrosine phosphatase